MSAPRIGMCKSCRGKLCYGGLSAAVVLFGSLDGAPISIRRNTRKTRLDQMSRLPT